MIATVAVGTDGSGTAEKAVRSALDLAERFGARVVFISAYTPVDESRLRHEKREAPEEVQWAINPDKHEADVLVIGNRGMQRRVLGSVPNTVTHKANCTVYLVKTT
jgi:nucleotide-binding universal stress UspA family protein